jgi:Flp pilus assembly pilin Flp
MGIMERSRIVCRSLPSRPARSWLARALRLFRATEGGTSIEYALLVGLIALVIIGALGNLGSALISLPLPALIAAFEGAGS